jgi:hypothetical protein
VPSTCVKNIYLVGSHDKSVYCNSMFIFVSPWGPFVYGLYYTYRVPECLSLRPNWLPPHPLPEASVSPPPGTKGGSNIRLRVRGWEETILTTGEKAWHSEVFIYMYSMGPFLTLKYILYFILVHNVLNILFGKCAGTVDEPHGSKN